MDLLPAAQAEAIQERHDASSQYAPRPKKERAGVALCLSGGGFRASLFHLGALRRLDELGVLIRINTFTAVSGGSITLGHLATKIADIYRGKSLPVEGSIFPDWKKQVAEPFYALVRRDLRTGPLLARLCPQNWFRPATAVRHLADEYERYLTKLRLVEIPAPARFVFCATDMVFGVNWEFDRTRMGDWLAGYVSPPPEDWPVARAVAASSCFPPVFSPLPLGLPARLFQNGAYAGSNKPNLLRGMRLTDGGVYDNFGLEPVWKNHAIVLVSDGGGGLDFDAIPLPIHTILRYTSVLQNQVVSLRKRWLISNLKSNQLEGTYWGVRSASSRYGQGSPPGYSKDFTSRLIARIRTDLNPFAPGEIAVLENHGYLLAEAALMKHVPSLYGTIRHTWRSPIQSGWTKGRQPLRSDIAGSVSHGDNACVLSNTF